MPPKVDIKSPYYPYLKTLEGAFNFRQFATFPRKICDYLIDAPQGDYTPIDDNSYPRARIWKYLFYDGARPLEQPLPTIEQKMSVVFNPEQPENPPTERGYRLIPQEFIKPAQTEAQTRIHVYMGRTLAPFDDTKYVASVIFDIFTHYTYEINTKSDEYSRSVALTAAIIEALNGVNMDGIGTFSMTKKVHPDAGTRPLYDSNTNIGQELTIGLIMPTLAENDWNAATNMPLVEDSDGNTLRLW